MHSGEGGKGEGMIIGGRLYPEAEPQAVIVWFLPFSAATS